MDMPTSAATGLTLKDLFDAGLHFGHQTKRWNPKMKPYIFDKRNGIHIIDLTQTVTMLDEAAEFVRKTILDGKKILFVATKKQAQEIVKQAAEECGQYYMTERWLGGTLTNSQTIRGSVKRMCQLQAVAKANGGQLSVHKQEASMLRRELAKLEKNLTGIKDMAEKPGAVFVIDVCRELNAVNEAARLHIPIVAITDTNANPDPIDCAASSLSSRALRRSSRRRTTSIRASPPSARQSATPRLRSARSSRRPSAPLARRRARPHARPRRRRRVKALSRASAPRVRRVVSPPRPARPCVPPRRPPRPRRRKSSPPSARSRSPPPRPQLPPPKRRRPSKCKM